jgi:hypothetical protein
MPYYEFEYILENLIDILEKKKEAEEGDGESQTEQRDSMMSKAKGMMPTMPNMSSYGGGSMPSFPSMPSGLKI